MSDRTLYYALRSISYNVIVGVSSAKSDFGLLEDVKHRVDSTFALPSKAFTKHVLGLLADLVLLIPVIY